MLITSARIAIISKFARGQYSRIRKEESDAERYSVHLRR
jgi:hypothetical protein